jgi:uncharacterized membrane protein YebE (DUF533 family)
MNKRPLIQNQPISNSLFYMWRCIIVIAHADGMIHDKERAYFANIFSNMDRVYGLSEEQKQAFADDLVNEKKISDLIRHINDPEIRGQLIYFGGLLARIDGDMHPSEEAILKKLHADQMASLDMEQIRTEVHAAVTSDMFRHDMHIDSYRPIGGIIGVVDGILLRLGIDIIRE